MKLRSGSEILRRQNPSLRHRRASSSSHKKTKLPFQSKHAPKISSPLAGPGVNRHGNARLTHSFTQEPNEVPLRTFSHGKPAVYHSMEEENGAFPSSFSEDTVDALNRSPDVSFSSSPHAIPGSFTSSRRVSWMEDMGERNEVASSYEEPLDIPPFSPILAEKETHARHHRHCHSGHEGGRASSFVSGASMGGGDDSGMMNGLRLLEVCNKCDLNSSQVFENCVVRIGSVFYRTRVIICHHREQLLYLLPKGGNPLVHAAASLLRSMSFAESQKKSSSMVFPSGLDDTVGVGEWMRKSPPLPKKMMGIPWHGITGLHFHLEYAKPGREPTPKGKNIDQLMLGSVDVECSLQKTIPEAPPVHSLYMTQHELMLFRNLLMRNARLRTLADFGMPVWSYRVIYMGPKLRSVLQFFMMHILPLVVFLQGMYGLQKDWPIIAASLAFLFDPIAAIFRSWFLWPIIRFVRYVWYFVALHFAFVTDILRFCLRHLLELFSPLRQLMVVLHRLLVNNRVITALLLLYRQITVAGAEVLRVSITLFNVFSKLFMTLYTRLGSMISKFGSLFIHFRSLFIVMGQLISGVFGKLFQALVLLFQMILRFFQLFISPMIRIGNAIVQPLVRNRKTIEVTAQNTGRFASLFQRIKTPFQKLSKVFSLIWKVIKGFWHGVRPHIPFIQEKRKTEEDDLSNPFKRFLLHIFYPGAARRNKFVRGGGRSLSMVMLNRPHEDQSRYESKSSSVGNVAGWRHLETEKPLDLSEANSVRPPLRVPRNSPSRKKKKKTVKSWYQIYQEYMEKKKQSFHHAFQQIKIYLKESNPLDTAIALVLGVSGILLALHIFFGVISVIYSIWG